MFDISDELQSLVAAFDENHIDYALCGGMAMAVHGHLRMTIDIDLLILSESLDSVFAIAKSLGYNIKGRDMSFAEGVIEIRRLSKIDPDDGELLSLDFLLVTPKILKVWETRAGAEWQGRRLSVVSADGLIILKELRGSAQDRADIEALKGRSNES